MKFFINIILVAASIFAASNVFAGDDEVRLRKALQADVTASNMPALLVRVDGRKQIQGRRRVWALEPGKHVIALEPDREEILRYESLGYKGHPMPRVFSEKTLEVDLEPGAEYVFSVKITNFDFQTWEPVLTKVERSD